VGNDKRSLGLGPDKSLIGVSPTHLFHCFRRLFATQVRKEKRKFSTGMEKLEDRKKKPPKEDSQRNSEVRVTWACPRILGIPTINL